MHSIEIPDKFSASTMKGLNDPNGISSTSRIEIIDALYTRMIQHRSYPTPYEYSVVCYRLVERFPTLQDSVGSGIVSEIKPCRPHCH